MTGDIDGIGDIVTGGLAASAVSRAGRRASARHSPDADIEHGLCLNCGAVLTGDYCASCGQSAHIHRSVAAFFHDLLHGVLHFEGKTWRTLPLLAWRPGELTRRYIHGERARFVSPMALFLFAVFLLFGVASFAGGDPDLTNAGPGVTTRMVEEAKALNSEIETQQAKIASGKLDAAELAKARSDLAEAEQAQQALMTGYRTLTGQGVGSTGTSREEAYADFMRNVDSDYRTAFNDAPLSQRPVVDASVDELQSLERSWLGRKVVQGIKKARENPSLVFYKIKTNAYKFGWALIPLSVPFVWIIMIGRRMRERRLYDHMIFTTYSIAFMMLLLVVLMVALMLGAPTGWIVLVGTLYPPFHMYRQLKGAYRLSRINALIRATLLTVFSLIALTLFVLLLVTAGLVA